MAAIINRIDSANEVHMRHFFETLSEKDRRRYAAVEAYRIGHGGIAYISELLGCSTKTISRGIDELDQLQDDPAAGRVRLPGAGRKKTLHRTQRSSKT